MDVDVVIPCHNHAHFLGEAIASVANQTLAARRIVVVDDGSTDDPAAVCRRFERVDYVRQSHSGLPASRNTGLARTTSPFVLFLDADDRLRPEGLALNAHVLSSRPEVAFVSGEHCYINMAGNLLKEWSRPAIDDRHYDALLRSNYIGMGATVMYRRERIEEIGGFDSALQACEDYDLYLRIARLYPVASHAGLVAEYRRYAGAMSTDPGRMLIGALSALHKQRRLGLRGAGLQDAYASGCHYWWGYYGPELKRRIGGDLRAMRLSGGIKGLLQFIRCLATEPRGAERLLRRRGIKEV